MLDQAIKTQLKAYLERLTAPVELAASHDGSEASANMRELLAEVAELSDHVKIAEKDGAGFKPSFTVGSSGGEARVRFAGLPLGHEFNSFILALLYAGGVTPKQPESLLAQVKALQGPLHFETFYSFTCQNCPDVVQALEPAGAPQSVDHAHGDRWRDLPGRSRGARHPGRAQRLSERQAVRAGQDGTG
jgi:alkyl hydroperoxide reductase subunit F